MKWSTLQLFNSLPSFTPPITARSMVSLSSAREASAAHKTTLAGEISVYAERIAQSQFVLS